MYCKKNDVDYLYIVMDTFISKNKQLMIQF